MKSIRTTLVLAVATVALGSAGCTSAGETTSSLSEIERSFATLVELFKAPEPDMKAYASTAKSFSENPDAMPYLEEMAVSENEDERAVTADVLGEIEDERAVVTLTTMIGDDSSMARKRVYVALRHHNTKKARAALAEAMRMHGPESGLAEAICEVMDEDLWATTREIIIKSTRDGSEAAFDPEVIHALIARAKEHEFEVGEFDSEEFELRMAKFGRRMKEMYGKGQNSVEGDWDDDATSSFNSPR